MKAKIFALLFTMLLSINGCSDSDKDNNFHNNNSSGNIPAKNPYDCDYDFTDDLELYYIEVTNPNPNGTPVKVKMTSHCYGTLIATLDNKLYHRKNDNSTFKDLNFNYPIKNIFSANDLRSYYDPVKSDACYILTEDNRLFSMGKDKEGELGLGSSSYQEVLEPREIKGINGKIRDVYTIYTIGEYTQVYVITEDNGKDRLYAWGYGYALGFGDRKNRYAPTELKIDGVNKIFTIIFGPDNYYKLIETDKGYYFFDDEQYKTPTPFNKVKVRFYKHHNDNQSKDIYINADKVYGDYILSDDKKLYGFRGSGLDAWYGTDLSKIIRNKDDIKEIIAMGSVNILLKTDGTVYSWAEPFYGIGEWEHFLGYEKDPAITSYDTPKKIETLSNIKKIHKAHSVLFALDNKGQVYSWGSDRYWLLGNDVNDGTDSRATPELVNITYKSYTDNGMTDYKYEIEDMYANFHVNSTTKSAVFAKVKGSDKLFIWGIRFYEEYPIILPLGCGVKAIQIPDKSIHDKYDENNKDDNDFIEILYDTGELRTWNIENQFRLQNYINIEPQK